MKVEVGIACEGVGIGRSCCVGTSKGLSTFLDLELSFLKTSQLHRLAAKDCQPDLADGYLVPSSLHETASLLKYLYLPRKRGPRGKGLFYYSNYELLFYLAG